MQSLGRLHWKFIVVLTLLSSFILLSAPPTPIQAAEHSNANYSNSSGTHCPSPPSNFDPLHASAGELRYYGLPLLPPDSDATATAQWANALRHAKHRVCNVRPIKTNRYSQPISSLHQAHPQTTTSPIWSGYFASGDPHGFEEVQAFWVVPTYNSQKSPSYSRAVSWVGIGGWFGNNLLQAGTSEDPTDGYNFWWEEYPKNYEFFIPWPNPEPGDTVTVLVDYNYVAPDGDHVYFEDQNDGGYYDNVIDYNFVPNEQSADWIDERSGCSLSSHDYYSLSDFQSVQWSNASAIDNASISHSISGFSNTQLTMYSGSTLAYPNALTQNGYAFKDNWQANGPHQCT